MRYISYHKGNILSSIWSVLVSNKIDNLEYQSGYTLSPKVLEFCNSLGWKLIQYFDIEKNVTGEIKEILKGYALALLQA